MSRISRRRFLGGLGVAGAVPLAGCGALGDGGDGSSDSPPLDRMEVSIYDMRRPSVGARSATIPIVLRFENPTDREIPSPSGDFDVFINGHRTVTAEPSLSTLEPGEEATTTQELLLSYDEYSFGLLDVLRDGAFEIRIEGTVRSEDATESVTLEDSYP